MSHWSGVAEAYDRTFGLLCAGATGPLLDALTNRVHGTLLDVGCGTGNLSRAALDRGFTVTGVDPQRDMINLAGRRCPDTAIVTGALPDLPFEASSFDTVGANFVVNHTPDPRAAVAGLVRVLRPGGRAAMTIWPGRGATMNDFWGRVMDRAGLTPPAGLRLPAELDFERTEPGLGALLRGAGLVDVVTTSPGWAFAIEPAELWIAVQAGIATIGTVFVGLQPPDRTRLRAAYELEIAALVTDGQALFPVTALLAAGTRPSAS